MDSTLRPIRVPPPRQLSTLTEGEQVAAGHLVQLESQALAHNASLELQREASIVRALQNTRRHAGPAIERPRIGKQPLGWTAWRRSAKAASTISAGTSWKKSR